MSDQQPSFWSSDSFKTISLWIFGIIAFWAVKGKDLLKLGMKAKKDAQDKADVAKDIGDQKLLQTTNEIMSNQERLLLMANHDLARLKEENVSLRATAQTFQSQYNLTVIQKQDLQEKYEALIAEEARLKSEKQQLQRRLNGALKHRSDEQAEDQQENGT